MTTVRKKLIEVSIPLEAINKASAREKSIRHGHPSTLHLWWARRPLAACRAVLFAQLVDDPSAWPDRFPDEAAQEAERRRLHQVIERLVPWEASNDEAILNEARFEIARSMAWGLGEEPPAKDDGGAILAYLQTKAPPVYDPFSGGGSIPLEAQRLGLRAYGSDLNPVAVLIGKALVEIPPKFAGQPPVNPENRRMLGWKGAQGLAEDVRYYGRWMREEAQRRIGHLYPKAKLPDGSEANVVAWIWARTVRSPDPRAKSAMVPLVSSFMLSTKEGKKTWVEPVIDDAAPDGYQFEIRTGVLSAIDEARHKKGTKSAKGEAFTCLLTGSAIDRGYIQAEGKADRLGVRLMAIVCEGNRRRVFCSPDVHHETVARKAEENPIVEEAKSSFLSSPTPTRAMITGGVCSAYGLRTWGQLFTSRQLVTLTTFSELVATVRERVLDDSIAAGSASDNRPLHSGGSGCIAYADAVATYVSLALGRLADLSSTIASWIADIGAIRNTFARQALPMVWDYAECNPITDKWDGAIEWISKCLDALAVGGVGSIFQCAAQDNNYPIKRVIISTDPPYYDNIGYATLADFFYVWHRNALSEVWPDMFRRLTTQKDKELVATPFIHGGKEQAEKFFMEGMKKALSAVGRASGAAEPLAIYYAFKQMASAEDGVTSAGWASFLQAIVDAGLTIDGTWPIRTERGARTVGIGANALASSIVLICRRRPPQTATVTRATFIRELKHELPIAIEKIRAAGVGPVDMQQSVIGPGMGVFTRYTKVLEDDDSVMSVKTALMLINRVWAEIESDLEGTFDAPTQVALAWFASYGFDVRPSGDLITLANAKNVALDTLFESGVFKDLRGKAMLTARSELPTTWNPTADPSLTVWECVQYTARVLAAQDGGRDAAAWLVAQMGSKAEEARALAYRLYEIAAQKGWSQEALAMNELAEEWTHVEDRALDLKPDLVPMPAMQARLI